jgi:hypothetical protein
MPDLFKLHLTITPLAMGVPLNRACVQEKTSANAHRVICLAQLNNVFFFPEWQKKFDLIYHGLKNKHCKTRQFHAHLSFPLAGAMHFNTLRRDVEFELA